MGANRVSKGAGLLQVRLVSNSHIVFTTISGILPSRTCYSCFDSPSLYWDGIKAEGEKV